MIDRKKPSKLTSQFRIPMELAEWLKQKAEENTRTVNGELIARLKESRQREEGMAHAT